MTGHWRFYPGVLLLALVSQTASQGAGQRPSSDGLAVTTRTAVVDGLELQYLSAGHGPARSSPPSTIASTPADRTSASTASSARTFACTS